MHPNQRPIDKDNVITGVDNSNLTRRTKETVRCRQAVLH